MRFFHLVPDVQVASIDREVRGWNGVVRAGIRDVEESGTETRVWGWISSPKRTRIELLNPEGREGSFYETSFYFQSEKDVYRTSDSHRGFDVPTQTLSFGLPRTLVA